jgi:hypothetical protein
MNRRQFAFAIGKARTEDERLAWFGALLTRESKLEGRLIIVGGSAIEIYLTSSKYVSMDIGVVGDKKAIAEVLQGWGFRPEEGRDNRLYWVREGLGNVDLVGPIDRSGLPPRTHTTPYGEVLLAPIEYLILRRLMRSGREHSTELFRQAEVLAAQYKRSLDWEYIKSQSLSERVLPLYNQLREQVYPGRSRRSG